MGWRTVVSGGFVQFMNEESSKPTTEMSSGTDMPSRRTARRTPRASTSLAQMMPVIPLLTSRVATAWPPSRENRLRSTESGPQSSPALRASASKASSFRCEGTWSSGPSTMPMRVCPSEVRWPKACSTATTSSVARQGKLSSLIAALTSTAGSRRSSSLK